MDDFALFMVAREFLERVQNAENALMTVLEELPADGQLFSVAIISRLGPDETFTGIQWDVPACDYACESDGKTLNVDFFQEGYVLRVPADDLEVFLGVHARQASVSLRQYLLSYSDSDESELATPTSYQKELTALEPGREPWTKIHSKHDYVVVDTTLANLLYRAGIPRFAPESEDNTPLSEKVFALNKRAPQVGDVLVLFPTDEEDSLPFEIFSPEDAALCFRKVSAEDVRDAAEDKGKDDAA